MAKMKRKPALICCGVLLAGSLALVVVFVALYFTMFRPRSPHVVMTVVSSKISFIKPNPPALNLTFDVEVTVDNPNYASFRYGEVVTEVRYHGAVVGQSVVPAEHIYNAFLQHNLLRVRDFSERSNLTRILVEGIVNCDALNIESGSLVTTFG